MDQALPLSIGKGSVYHGAPTTICEDNQGAIKIADNPINHPKTKHIAVRYHAIRDHISNGEVRLSAEGVLILLKKYDGWYAAQCH